MNALADLLRAAAAGPGARAVVADRRQALPLAEALHRAEGLARDLRAVAGRPHPVVAVALPASVDAVVHLLAAVLGDHTVALLDPADAGRAAGVLEAVDPDVVVDGEGARVRARTAAGVRAPGYVARSSGSTGGGPKGVLTTWACLADFVPHGAAALRVGDGACWAEPNHPAYDLALTNWLVALGAGASLHVSSALADRLRPLAFASRVAATHVRLAPRYVDLAAAEARRGARATVRVWGSGGDRLTADRAAQVLDLGVPTLVNTFGTSETAGFASAAAFHGVEDLATVRGVVSIGAGRLGPWRVRLDPEPTATVPGEVLSICSPHLGGGYLFGGAHQDYPRWEPGRVVTGDLGARVGEDHYCFGRAGRLVKRHAGFVNLDDVDLALRRHRGLDSFTLTTPDGRLVTLVQGARGDGDALRAELSRVLAPDVLPDDLVWVGALPRLGNGKADQAGALALAERALAGDGAVSRR